MPGRPYQLSDSCLHSTMDASQIRDGPFNFWGGVELNKYLFVILMWKHVRTAIYAPGRFSMISLNQFMLVVET